MPLVSFGMIAMIMCSFGMSLLAKGTVRKIFLLAISMVFVLLCGNAWHLAWLCAVSIYACIMGKWIAHTKKKWTLFGSILPLVGALCLFKYSPALGFDNFVMPLGISFYTFKIISFFCDLYQGKCECPNSLDVLVYVMFFPSVSAGPIHRAQSFFNQLNTEPVFEYDQARNSLLLVALGMFQKLVFADTLSGMSNSILSNDTYTGPYLALAMIMYSFQLYIDFDAYSNIAIGTSSLVGIHLEKNFNTPYLSTSIMEFWNRWHISLSSWLKDYIYIPLGGNRKGELRRILNIFCVFLISGIWHGSSWVFVFWGLGHGLVHVVESRISKKSSFFDKKGPFMELMKIMINFGIVTLLWVFFRSPNVSAAFDLFRRTLQISRASLSFASVGGTVPELIWILTVIGVTVLTDCLRNKKDMISWITSRPAFVRWSFYFFLIFITLVFGAYGPGHNASDFIYISF